MTGKTSKPRSGASLATRAVRPSVRSAGTTCAETAAAAAPSPNAQDGPSIDPRVARSRERVLTATLELLTDAGLGALTIDDVSKRSRVAKTTIYRHWSDRNALIVDACRRMTDGAENPPETGSVEGDVRASLTHLANLLTTARWSSIMPSIIDAAEREPEIAEIHSQLQLRHAAPLLAVLQRAVQRGQVSSDVDISAVASALRGPLYFRRWFSREPVDQAFIDLIVRVVMASLVDAG